MPTGFFRILTIGLSMTAILNTQAPAIVVRAFKPAVATAEEWQAYHEFCRVRALEDDPNWPTESDADRQRHILQQWPLGEQFRFIALIDDRIAGNLGISRRRAGTPDYDLHAPFTWLWGGVRKDVRRQGVATRLLCAAADFMTENRQTTATASTQFEDGRAFFDAIGAVEKLRVMENRLATAAVDWDAMTAWEQSAQAVEPSLRWEVYDRRVPLDRYDALTPAMSKLFSDVPQGTLEQAPMQYNRASLETWYADIDVSGGNHFLVLLLRGDELVAVCDAAWTAQFPDRAFQNLTAVTRAWRGKGLAKAVKARMMRQMRETQASIELIITTNANVNASMLAINRRLGFVQHKDVRTYQISVDRLRLAAADVRGG